MRQPQPTRDPPLAFASRRSKIMASVRTIIAMGASLLLVGSGLAACGSSSSHPNETATTQSSTRSTRGAAQLPTMTDRYGVEHRLDFGWAVGQEVGSGASTVAQSLARRITAIPATVACQPTDAQSSSTNTEYTCSMALDAGLRDAVTGPPQEVFVSEAGVVVQTHGSSAPTSAAQTPCAKFASDTYQLSQVDWPVMDQYIADGDARDAASHAGGIAADINVVAADLRSLAQEATGADSARITVSLLSYNLMKQAMEEFQKGDFYGGEAMLNGVSQGTSEAIAALGTGYSICDNPPSSTNSSATDSAASTTATTRTTTTTSIPDIGFTPGDQNPNDAHSSDCARDSEIGPRSDCSVEMQVRDDLIKHTFSVPGSDTVTDGANIPGASPGLTITFHCKRFVHRFAYIRCESRTNGADWFKFEETDLMRE